MSVGMSCWYSMPLGCVIFLTISITQFLFYECAVPTLSVRKFDTKLIERKRQDTLEICRIFNEENSYHNNNNNDNNNNNNNVVDYNKYSDTKRVKRNIGKSQHDTSVLDREDIVRVENIVDKLYDDVEQTGSKVAYRRRVLENPAKKKKASDQIQRRFNFAPAELYGPLPRKDEDSKPIDTGSPKIPWIKKWKYGIIPFFIDSNSYDYLLADTIKKAFDYFEKVTCIRLQRLRERPIDKKSMQEVEWLYITNPSGVRQCVHSNERKPNTGVQMMVLGYDCLSQGEIIHEVMHVLGFSHEHTRPDRDRYVTVLWNNIKSGYKKYFEIREDDPLSNFPYDYASVLHYPQRAFSKNGQYTIMTEGGIKIGQREALSELDVEKVGMIYGIECVERNKNYLMKTCPSAVKVNKKPGKVTANEIKDYYKERTWQYGIVNYKIKDKIEFTSEERQNIQAVLKHIEKETCIEFRDISIPNKNSDEDIKNKSDQIDENNNATSTTTGSGGENDEKLHNSDNEVLDVDDEFNVTLLRFGKEKRLNKSKEVTTVMTEKVRIPLPLTASRRHAASVLEIVRSSEPGCECPPPGRPQGKKVLTINSDCFNSVNDLLHLFVHVLGLDHQHNMHDRDSYLHILWENISPEIKEDMQRILPPAASAGFPYDYQSVMHYPWLQIKNGVTNIMYPIWNDGWAMGHWQGLSWTDVQKINTIYKEECSKRRSETKK